MSSRGLIRLQSYSGRLGNVLIEYASMVNLANELQYNYQLPPIMVGSVKLLLPYDTSKSHTNSRGYTRQVKLNVIHTISIPREAYGQRWLIDMVGYFQQVKNVNNTALRDSIKTAFIEAFVRQHGVLSSLPQSDVIIHVRAGDQWLYNTNNHPVHPKQPVLPIAFYKQTLGLDDATTTVTFITERLADQFIDVLRATFPKATFQSRDLLTDFLSLMLAPHKLVMSVSTLSWCATWLNTTATEIIFPIAGFWHPEDWSGRCQYSRQNLDTDASNMFIDDPRITYYDFGFSSDRPWLGNSEDFHQATKLLSPLAPGSHVGNYEGVTHRYPKVLTT